MLLQTDTRLTKHNYGAACNVFVLAAFLEDYLGFAFDPTEFEDRYSQAIAVGGIDQNGFVNDYGKLVPSMSAGAALMDGSIRYLSVAGPWDDKLYVKGRMNWNSPQGYRSHFIGIRPRFDPMGPEWPTTVNGQLAAAIGFKFKRA